MLATLELLAEAAQRQRLAEALPRWLSEAPLYASAAASAESAEPMTELERLRRLPFINKQDIRRGFPQNFLGKRELEALLEGDEIELEHTSGTSEERTSLLLPRGWWAAQEQRALQLNPLVESVLEKNPEARRVTISSPVCSGEICYTGVPSRSERTLGNSLFIGLSRYPFLWGEKDLARMAAEAVSWAPVFLDMDPVYGALFALYCERRGIRLPGLQFVLCSYEFVSVVHRRILERAFGAPVFNLYGSTETGHLLMEDDLGQMRPSLETAFLEVIEPDARGVAELAVTTLTNEFMPLIRYRIGDLVEKFEHPFFTRYRVHGRVLDAFVGAQGGRISTWQVDQCFSEVRRGIVHYQLIERPGKEWLLRFVPDQPGPDPGAMAEAQERLGALLGRPEALKFEAADLVAPESSGKFRLGYPAREQGR